MYSKTDIFNLALGHIGHTALIANADTDNDTAARQCRLYWGISRRTVLSDFPWTFATKIVQLAKLTGEANPFYQFAYAMPVDCIEPIQLVMQSAPVTGIEFMESWGHSSVIGGATQAAFYDRPRFEKGLSADGNSRVIYTDVESPSLQYIADVEGVTLYSALFVDALSLRLAAYLANSLAKSASLSQQMIAQYKMVINAAAASDANGQAKPADPLPDSVTARLC